MKRLATYLMLLILIMTASCHGHRLEKSPNIGETDVKENETITSEIVAEEEGDLPTEIEAEEYEVIMTIIKHDLDERHKPVVVRAETIDEELTSQGLDEYMENDFRQKNERSYRLDQTRMQGLPVRLISDQKYHEYTKDWGKFHADFPKAFGISSFSRVGFNKEKTQALVVILSEIGIRAAGCYLSLYEKQNGEWKEVNSRALWLR